MKLTFTIKTGTPDVKPPGASAFFTPSAAKTECRTPPLKRQWVAEPHPVSQFVSLNRFVTRVRAAGHCTFCCLAPASTCASATGPRTAGCSFVSFRGPGHFPDITLLPPGYCQMHPVVNPTEPATSGFWLSGYVTSGYVYSLLFPY